MAGVAGRVTNRSGMPTFTVRQWEAWMTEAVILHLNGVSIPELAVKFNRSRNHMQNLMNATQAFQIGRDIQQRVLKTLTNSAVEKVAAAKDKALDKLNHFLDDPNNLADEKPIPYWEATIKTLSALDKLDKPQAPQGAAIGVQNNFVISNPAADRLRAALEVPALEITSQPLVVESPRAAERGLHGRADRETANQGEDGPSVPIKLRLEPSDGV